MTLNPILLRLPLSMGIIGTCHQAQLLQHRESNPEIHACQADALPAQLYPQPCLLSDTSLGCIIREMVDSTKEHFLKTNAFPASCISLGFKIIFQRNPLDSHIPLWHLDSVAMFQTPRSRCLYFNSDTSNFKISPLAVGYPSLGRPRNFEDI